jgi:serine-type D-Ala-D-Ala carboxypeptidase/endopeptidase (penicillin-binding protein 4)
MMLPRRRRLFVSRRRRGRRLVPAVLVAVLVAGGWVALSDRERADAPVGASEVQDGDGADPDGTQPDTTGLGGDRADGDDEDRAAAPEGQPVDAEVVGDGAVLDAVDRQLPEDRPELRDRDQQLHDEVLAIMASLDRSLEGATLTVAIRDDEGRRILDVGPEHHLMPASTMKSVTAATVLHVLGPDHRFTTTLASTAPVEDGVVRGDLVLLGGGDPVLTSEDYRRHVYPSRPATHLEELADAVVEAGITTVTGRLVADGWGWAGSDVAAGWRASYLDDMNARRITRLTVDAGLDVDVTIAAPVQVVLRGTPDPTARAAKVFASMLAERGVAVRGHVRTSPLPVTAPHHVADIQSPPVRDLLRFTMQRSDNHLADSLLREAAHVATGDGSWAGAHRTAVAVMEALGIDAAGMRVADGSGLSRLNRVSAGQLVDLDVAMMAGPHAAVWQESQAVTGREGTLRNRLRGTAGDGRFWGKTGTLDDAKAVVGHAIPGEGSHPRLHMAVITNGIPYGGNSATTVLMDRVQMAMVDHLDGCSTTWTEFVPHRVCAAS